MRRRGRKPKVSGGIIRLVSQGGWREDMVEAKLVGANLSGLISGAFLSILLAAGAGLAMPSRARAQAQPAAQATKDVRPAKHAQAAVAAKKPRVIPITINKGETYTITGLEKGAATASKPGKNPNALTVQPQPSGDIVLLGTEGGRWKIKATLADGEKVVYDVKVKAGAPPINSLDPGTAPTAIAP